MIWAVLLSQVVVFPLIRSQYGLAKLVALAVVLAVGAWRPRYRSSRLDWPWWVFLASFAVTTAASPAWPLSLCGIYLAGSETCLLALLCFLAYRAGQGQDVSETLEAGAAVAVLAVVASYWMGDQSGRLIGPIGQAARFGTYLSMGAAMALSGRHALWVVPFLAMGVMATGSRGAALAAILAAAYLHRRRLPPWAFAVGGAAFVFCCVAFNSRVQSDAMRLLQAKAAWHGFLTHPWLGWGPGAFLLAAPGIEQMHAHVLPLNVLTTQGLVGAAAWTFLGISAWRAAGRGVRAVYVAAGVCSCFNPLPISAYVILAFIYGAAQRGPIHQRLDWPRALLSTLLATALLVAAYADRQAKLAEEGGPNAHYFWARAHRFNPLETYYFARAVRR